LLHLTGPIFYGKNPPHRYAETMCLYKHRFVVKTVKHSASVMVWGCFRGKRGRGGLYFLPENCMMNRERYKKVLKNTTPFFLQYGTPFHKSKPSSSSQRRSSASSTAGELNCWSYMR
jgi:hypothetical protein